MDEFFQRLREIQKKERSISGLANVGDNFYKDVYNYLDKLMKKIGNNPFSFDSYLLRDARRIASEICERREHKITDSAILNVQKTSGLFNNKSENTVSTSPNAPPANLTPEEENLYYSITESLIKYREEMLGPLKPLNREKSVKNQRKPPVSSTKNENNDKKAKRPLSLGIEQDIASFHELEQSIMEDIPGSRKEDQMDDTEDDHIETIMALEPLPSIMGVDNNIYGPLSPQDIITMPKPNAMILINNNKGRSIEKYKKISYK